MKAAVLVITLESLVLHHKSKGSFTGDAPTGSRYAGVPGYRSG